MKIKTDRVRELEVPELIIRDWEKHREQYEDIEQFIHENAYEYLTSHEGQLADKDLAIFLRGYEIGHIPSWGGYYADNQFSFKDGKNRYTILAFGWNDENGKPDIHMIGYKEL